MTSTINNNPYNLTIPDGMVCTYKAIIRAGRALDINTRIHELVFKDGPLTPEEQAELAAYERMAQ